MILIENLSDISGVNLCIRLLFKKVVAQLIRYKVDKRIL